jgi:hypothetical protein
MLDRELLPGGADAKGITVHLRQGGIEAELEEVGTARGFRGSAEKQLNSVMGWLKQSHQVSLQLELNLMRRSGVAEMYFAASFA